MYSTTVWGSGETPQLLLTSSLVVCNGLVPEVRRTAYTRLIDSFLAKNDMGYSL